MQLWNPGNANDLAFSGLVSTAANGPRDLELVDLDGDDHLDLVTVGQSIGELITWSHAGGGTFSEVTRLTIGADARALTIADFNGDGRPDAATANGSSHDVAVMLNQGGGIFAGPLRQGVGAFPIDLVAGDFNRDGLEDLAVVARDGRELVVLAGQGDGTFTETARLATGERPQAVAVGDVDQDLDLDLAVVTLGDIPSVGEVLLFSNDGGGVFGSLIRWAPGALDAALEDLNGDGWPELVVPRGVQSSGGFNGISVFVNDGQGSLEEQIFATDPGAVILDLGDLDGDGDPKVVVGHRQVTTSGSSTSSVTLHRRP